MNTLIKIGIITLLTGCTNSNEPKNLNEFMVDISKFKINMTALENGEYVEILGSSGNLTKEHKIDFYNLVVVRSVKTGDTVNVLVTNFFQSDLNKRTTRFISNASVVGKILESHDMGKDLDNKNIRNLKAISYEKVFYDSEYIQVNVLEYPSITGILGYNIDGDVKNLGKIGERESERESERE